MKLIVLSFHIYTHTRTPFFLITICFITVAIASEKEKDTLLRLQANEVHRRIVSLILDSLTYEKLYFEIAFYQLVLFFESHNISF